MKFTIVDLTAADGDRIEQAAELLRSAFSPVGAWTTIEEARHPSPSTSGSASTSSA